MSVDILVKSLGLLWPVGGDENNKRESSWSYNALLIGVILGGEEPYIKEIYLSFKEYGKDRVELEVVLFGAVYDPISFEG